MLEVEVRVKEIVTTSLDNAKYIFLIKLFWVCTKIEIPDLQCTRYKNKSSILRYFDTFNEENELWCEHVILGEIHLKPPAAARLINLPDLALLKNEREKKKKIKRQPKWNIG